MIMNGSKVADNGLGYLEVVAPGWIMAYICSGWMLKPVIVSRDKQQHLEAI